MFRRMFKSKIHRATVTQADLNYEGSLTIDGTLMDAADILNGEEVHVWNVSRGTRLSTYAIRGASNSGVICINGAAAHLVGVGDLVIVATFVTMPTEEAMIHSPNVVMVDGKNSLIARCRSEVAGPERRVEQLGMSDEQRWF